MKNILTFVLTAFFIAAFATGCRSEQPNTGKKTDATNSRTSEDVQIPSPWTDCETVEAAETLAGFDITAPETLDSYDQKVIRVMNDEIIQIGYYADDETYILLRKGKGDKDASGVYTEYENTETAEVNSVEVTLKGNGEKINIATWTDGDYSYSVYSTKGESRDFITSICENLK